MKSLERRLALGLLLTLLAIFALLLWGAGMAVRSLSEAYLQTRLEHDSEALLAAFGPTPHGQLKIREGRIIPIYRQPLSGHYYVLLLDDGTTLKSRSLWDETLQITPLPTGAVSLSHQTGPAGQELLLRTAGYEKAGTRFTLAVAEDFTPMRQHIERFQLTAFILLSLALLVVVLVQRFVLRHGFGSLDEVRHDLLKVADGRQHQVQHLGPTEIRPLTEEINRLLSQLQKRLQRSRQALGNLAHAIKAPLSLVLHDVEQLSIDVQQKAQLQSSLERIRQMVERELKRARIAGDASGQRFVPKRDVPELLAAVSQMYAERSLSISNSPLPDIALPIDYQDALELLGNLLDNACKWAKQDIHLDIRAGQQLIVEISDDGPGISQPLRNTLMDRGTKLDEQKAGHGLGLAIVRDLVEDYEGSLQLSTAETLGGLKVRISLPLESKTSL